MKTTTISEAAISDHLSRLDRDGFTVLENAIPAELLAELKAALAAIEQEHNFGYRDTAFEGTHTTRIYNLLSYHPAFAKIPVFEGALPLIERILDPGLQLSSLSAICPGPGQQPQPLHSDSQMIPLPRPHVPIAVNSMWALSDFREENGATRIVPGSHLADHDPDYDGVYDSAHDVVCAEMDAGSILVWHSTLWHGGGHNRSQARRDGIACYYCAGWLRQQENQQLGIEMERLRGFPRRLQELCGFSVYRGIYGHIENADPIELLGRERTAKMVWQASDEVRKS